MNTRIAAIVLVVVLALVGGAIVLTGGQNQSPVVAASPTPSATVAPATPSPTAVPTPTLTPTPTVSPTPMPSPTVTSYVLSGKVTDAATSNGVAQAIVRAFDTKYCNQVGGSVPASGQAVSGTDGTYRINIQPGTYWVIVTARGYQTSETATCSKPLRVDRNLTLDVALKR